MALGWKKKTSGSVSVRQDVTINRQGATLTARSSLRRPTAGAVSGGLTVQIWTQEVNYEPLAASGCASSLTRWETGRNQNEVSSTTAFVFRDSGYFQPTTSWINVDFAQTTMPTSGHAIGVRIRMVNDLEANGENRQMDIDNSRVYDS